MKWYVNTPDKRLVLSIFNQSTKKEARPFITAKHYFGCPYATINNLIYSLIEKKGHEHEQIHLELREEFDIEK